ncbi:hypothetical protein IWQ61_005328 [Dispira simplex]|nr:hypothetical protein IWQ61_005328 [Dispira simplex]
MLSSTSDPQSGSGIPRIASPTRRGFALSEYPGGGRATSPTQGYSQSVETLANPDTTSSLHLTGHSVGRASVSSAGYPASVSLLTSPVLSTTSQTGAMTRGTRATSSSTDSTGLLPVQVALRVRPLLVSADQGVAGASHSSLPALGRTPLSARHTNEVIHLVPSTSAVTVNVPGTGVGSGLKQFTFDYVFGPQSAQSDIYEASVVPLLDKFVDGYNVTILAYGQTSSGKTYTMGTGLGCEYNLDPGSQGIIPRAIHTLFQFLALQPPEWVSYQVSVSYLEVYNEDLIDLLAAYEGVAHPPITIREDTRGRIFWSGVREEPVRSAEEVLQLLEAGSRIRQTNTTDMNEKSSRSHAIFSVSLRQERWVNGHGPTPAYHRDPSHLLGLRPASPVHHPRHSAPYGALIATSPDASAEKMVTYSKFHFVDLAGSERLKRTHSVGERVKEGISINSGLLALGNVISALGDTAKRVTHVPYRDSKLTRLLQDSLGGNSQTLMIACVSPAESNLSETLNTLKYANRARNIKNQATLNQELSNDVETLRSQIHRLKAELGQVKGELKQYQQGGGPLGARANHRISMPISLLARDMDDDPMDHQPTAVTMFRKQNESLTAEFEQLNDTYTDLLLKFNNTSFELTKAKENLHEKTQLVLTLQSEMLDANTSENRLLSPKTPRSSSHSGAGETPLRRQGSRIPAPSGSSNAFGTEVSPDRTLGVEVKYASYPLRRKLSQLRTQYTTPNRIRSNPTDYSLSEHGSPPESIQEGDDSLEYATTLQAEILSLRAQLGKAQQKEAWYQTQLNAVEKVRDTQEIIIQQLQARRMVGSTGGHNTLSTKGGKRRLGDESPPPGLAENLEIPLVRSEEDLTKTGVIPGHFSGDQAFRHLMDQLDEVKQELTRMHHPKVTTSAAQSEDVPSKEAGTPPMVEALDSLTRSADITPVLVSADVEEEEGQARWELRATIRRLEKQMRERDAEIHRLHAELRDWAEDHARRPITPAPQLTSDSPRVTELERENSTLRDQRQAAEELCQRLREDMGTRTVELERGIKHLRQRLGESESQLAQQQAVFDRTLDQMRSEYEQEMVEMQARATELEMTISELDAKLGLAEEERDEHWKRYEQVELQYHDRVKVTEELEQHLELLLARLPEQQGGAVSGSNDGVAGEETSGGPSAVGKSLGAELMHATQGFRGSEKNEEEGAFPARKNHPYRRSVLASDADTLTRSLTNPVTSTFQELQEAVSRLQKENTDMCQQLSDSQRDLTAKKQALEAKTAEEHQRLSLDLVTAQRELVELRSQLEVLQTQYDQALLDLETGEHTLGVTQQQLRLTRQDLAQLEKNQENLRTHQTLETQTTADLVSQYDLVGRLAQALIIRQESLTHRCQALYTTHQKRLDHLTTSFDSYAVQLAHLSRKLGEQRTHDVAALRTCTLRITELEETNHQLTDQVRSLDKEAQRLATALSQLQSTLQREMGLSESKIAQLRAVVTKYENEKDGDSTSDLWQSILSASETETRVDGDEPQSLLGVLESPMTTQSRGLATTAVDQSHALENWQSRLLGQQRMIEALTEKLAKWQDEQREEWDQAQEAFAQERKRLMEQRTTLQVQLEALHKAQQVDMNYRSLNHSMLSAAAAAEAAMVDLQHSDVVFEGSHSDIFYDASVASDSALHRSMSGKESGDALKTMVNTAVGTPSGRSSGEEAGLSVDVDGVKEEETEAKVSMGTTSPTLVRETANRSSESTSSALPEAQMPTEDGHSQESTDVGEGALDSVNHSQFKSSPSEVANPHYPGQVMELQAKVGDLESDKLQLLEKVQMLEYELEHTNNRQDLVTRHLEAAMDRHQQQFQDTPIPTATLQLPPQSIGTNVHTGATPESAILSDLSSPGTLLDSGSPVQSSPIARSLSFIAKGFKSASSMASSGKSDKPVAMGLNLKDLSQPPPGVYNTPTATWTPGEERASMYSTNSGTRTPQAQDDCLSPPMGPLPPPPSTEPIPALQNGPVTNSSTVDTVALTTYQKEVERLEREVNQLDMKNRQLTKTTNSMEEELLHVADLNDQLEEELGELRQRVQIYEHQHQSSLRTPSAPPSVVARSRKNSQSARSVDPHGGGFDLDSSLLNPTSDLDNDSIMASSPPNQSFTGLFNNSFGPIERSQSNMGYRHGGCHDTSHQRLNEDISELHTKLNGLQVLVDEQQGKIQRQESILATTELKLRETEAHLEELREEKTHLETQLEATQRSSNESTKGPTPRPSMDTDSIMSTDTSRQAPPSLSSQFLHRTGSVKSPGIQYTDAEIIQMRNRIRTLESDIQAHLNLVQTLESTLTETEQEREQTQRNMEELNQQVLSQTSEIKTLRDQLHVLRMQLDEAKNWADLEKRKLEMLKLKNRELTEEITDLKASKKSSGGFLCF